MIKITDAEVVAASSPKPKRQTHYEVWLWAGEEWEYAAEYDTLKQSREYVKAIGTECRIVKIVLE
jgi:hypothetical protein